MKTTKLTLCLIAIFSSFWIMDSSASQLSINTSHSSRISLKGDLQPSSTRSLESLQVIDVIWNNECLEVIPFSDLGKVEIYLINSDGSTLYENQVLLIKDKVYEFNLGNLMPGEYVLKFVNMNGKYLTGNLFI